jgi:Protein of unknown function (DUF1580)
MIDTQAETLITIPEAIALVPGRAGEKPVAPSTLYRWASWGLDGIRLETVMVGARAFTTRQALDRFFAALTEQRDKAFGEPVQGGRRRGRAAQTSIRTPKRQAEIDAAMKLARAELAPQTGKLRPSDKHTEPIPAAIAVGRGDSAR